MRIFIFSLLTMLGCATSIAQQKSIALPVADFFHLDLVVDAEDFEQIRKDKFWNGVFGNIFVDSSSINGKPSTEIYMLGQETFLHINLNQGYWENRTGGGGIIFQSRFPDNLDSIANAWQEFYPDSILRRKVKTSAGDEVSEVAIYSKRDSASPVVPAFYPVFLSFSRSSYLNWGFTNEKINQGISMKEYMHSWDTSLQRKLFRKITAIHVRVTETERQWLESGLKTAGYQNEKNVFSHAEGPTVFIEKTALPVIPRVSQIDILLAAPVAAKTIRLGKQYIARVEGESMQLLANGR
jgi:hypothetical protein